MNEVTIRYGKMPQNPAWQVIEILLNGVVIKQGVKGPDSMIAFKEGFLLGCTKLLTFYSVKEVHLDDE